MVTEIRRVVCVRVGSARDLLRRGLRDLCGMTEHPILIRV